MSTAYSTCRFCKEPVKLGAPTEELARSFSDTERAECKVCNEKSNWVRCSAWELTTKGKRRQS